MLPPAREAPAAASRDAGRHAPTVSRPSREQITAMSTCPGRRRPGRARAAAVMIVLATALPAAACSSGSPSSAGASGSPQAGGSANSSSGLAYSRCVRAHGVPNFPDPGSGGQLSKQAVVTALRAVSDSRAAAATGACARLNPAGQEDPVLTSQEQQDYLRAAACMRSHGITGFPDPTFPGGRLRSPDPRQHRYHVRAVHSGRADLHKTHPGRAPPQQRVRWLMTIWAWCHTTMPGSTAGGGS